MGTTLEEDGFRQMSVQAHGFPERGLFIRERPFALLAIALLFAVAAQFLLVMLFASKSITIRDNWNSALALFFLLTLSSIGVFWPVWIARHRQISWGVGALLAIAGLLMRAPYFGAGPMLEDDHFRYLLDGAMVAKGFSPYALSPEAVLSGSNAATSGIVTAGRSVIEGINFPDLRSMYPGAAQALFALAHLIAPWKIDGLRVVVFGAEVLTALLIWSMLKYTDRSPIQVALYWCNPLMAFCLTGQAHIDAALAPPILIALFAAFRGRGLLAGTAIGFAVSIKLWPVLLGPLLLKAFWPDRKAMAAFVLAGGVTMLLLVGPLLWASMAADAGLAAYAGGWSVNNFPFAWASSLFFHLFGEGTGDRILRGLIVVSVGVASLYLGLRTRTDRPGDLVAATALMAAVVFYLSPAQFPWYSAWFLPLAVASGSWALSFGAVGLPIYYLFFPLAAAGVRHYQSYGLAAFHLLPLILALVFLRRSAPEGVTR
jgi:alpha-1,6-mannosyltransferase